MVNVGQKKMLICVAKVSSLCILILQLRSQASDPYRFFANLVDLEATRGHNFFRDRILDIVAHFVSYGVKFYTFGEMVPSRAII